MVRITQKQQRIGFVAVLVALMVSAGWLSPGLALANGCNLRDHRTNPQVDRILSGTINEDLVIEDAVCIGSTDPSVITVVNGDILIKPGGEVKIGGKEKPASVNGDIIVKNKGSLTVRDLVRGDIFAEGKAKVKLAFLARVEGDIEHVGGGDKPGSVDFKGGPNQEGFVEDPIHDPGTQIYGDVSISGGAQIKASGPNEANFIQGDLVCGEGSRVDGGTAEDWDGKGVDGDAQPDGTHPPFTKVAKGHDHARDGIVGGDYDCAK